MLRYTGHPFVDVGVATITAFSKKQRPEEVNLDDLEEVAVYLKETYSKLKSIQNFLSSIFLNSSFVQHSKKLADKQLYADEVLFAFRPDTKIIKGVPCVFFPEQSAVMLAHRQYVPLLNGNGITNFSPMGNSGLAVSGIALLAIHAMPLGCMKCGYPIAFHQLRSLNDSSRDMTLILARKALKENRQAISDMYQEPENTEIQLPNHGSFKRTRYVEAILDAASSAKSARSSIKNITGYFFTNYGPKPDLQLLRLDNTVASFVSVAQNDTLDAWNRVTYFAWQAPKGEENTTPDANNTHTWRNNFYEMLFDLPQKSRAFLKFLEKGNDWLLIEIFLRKVLQMDQERVQTYKRLGDLLGQYLVEFESPSLGFYHQFARADKYAKLRNIIRIADEKILKAGGDPIFNYDGFIYAFETSSGDYTDWKLGRDLICIRMREVIAQNRSRFNIAELPDTSPEELKAQLENENE